MIPSNLPLPFSILEEEVKSPCTISFVCFLEPLFSSPMYNGIGLKTARGSGTNGFVQRNMSYIRPSRMLEFSKRMEPEIMEPKMKNQDKAILEHQVKREIEVFLMDLEDKMKEQGYARYTHG